MLNRETARPSFTLFKKAPVFDVTCNDLAWHFFCNAYNSAKMRGKGNRLTLEMYKLTPQGSLKQQADDLIKA